MSKQFISNVWDRYKPNPYYIMEGYDDCVIGFDFTNSKLVYSETLILEQLSLVMDFDEALDFYYQNIINKICDKVIICSTMGQ